MLFKKAENNRIPKVKCRLNHILKHTHTQYNHKEHKIRNHSIQGKD